jgi:hypothetical protein
VACGLGYVSCLASQIVEYTSETGCRLLSKQIWIRAQDISSNGTYPSWNLENNAFPLYAFFWVIPRRLNFICRRFGTLCSIFIGGEVYNYPEESIQHSEHGRSLKSKMHFRILQKQPVVALKI